MVLMGVPKFVRFFRSVAGLDVDKDDLKRYSDFVNGKVYDLLLRSQAVAKANGRDVIQPQDLPITKGLQECIQAFRKADEALELEPILTHLAGLPQLDLDYSVEVRDDLPEVAGGLSVALARTFTFLDPGASSPRTEQWQRAFHIFGLLL